MAGRTFAAEWVTGSSSACNRPMACWVGLHFGGDVRIAVNGGVRVKRNGMRSSDQISQCAARGGSERYGLVPGYRRNARFQARNGFIMRDERCGGLETRRGRR